MLPKSFVIGHPQDLHVDIFVKMAMLSMGEESDEDVCRICGEPGFADKFCKEHYLEYLRGLHI